MGGGYHDRLVIFIGPYQKYLQCEYSLLTMHKLNSVYRSADMLAAIFTLRY